MVIEAETRGIKTKEPSVNVKGKPGFSMEITYLLRDKDGQIKTMLIQFHAGLSYPQDRPDFVLG